MHLQLALEKAEISLIAERLRSAIHNASETNFVLPTVFTLENDTSLVFSTGIVPLQVKNDSSISLELSSLSPLVDENMATLHIKCTIESMDFSIHYDYYKNAALKFVSTFSAILIDLGLTTEDHIESIYLSSYN